MDLFSLVPNSCKITQLSCSAWHHPGLSDPRVHGRALLFCSCSGCARETGKSFVCLGGSCQYQCLFLPATGKLPAGSACSDVHMALCAVNLAECAEEKISPSTLVEIHLTAAMGLKTRCGGKLGFLAVSTLQFRPTSHRCGPALGC